MIKLQYNNILFDALPTWFRTGTTYNFLQACWWGSQQAYNWYEGYATANDYELKHNAQKLSFEQYLNYHIPTNSGITLGDGFWIDHFFEYFQTDIDSGYGYPSYFSFQTESSVFRNYLFFQSELNQGTYDFTVSINTGDATASNLALLNGYINMMRLSGTVYKIIYL